MALLLSPAVSFLASSPSPRLRPLSATANASSSAIGLQWKKLANLQKPLNATAMQVSFTKKRLVVLVQASAEAGAGDTGDAESPEKPKQAMSIATMPLESKQKMIEEQRLRMKLAKKLRQRRKRLVRKRRLRKKGRWPPSKMRKLKNV